MAYSPNTWIDRIISGALRYDIKDNGGSSLYTQIQIILHNTVSQIGSPLIAAWMNNIEFGIVTADANASSALSQLSAITGDGTYAHLTAGTSTAYTFTTTPNPALTTLEAWVIKFHATAGAAPTLNRDGRGAKPLKYYDSTAQKIACGPTTIYAGMVTAVVWDGTDYVLFSIPTPKRATYTSGASQLNPTGTTSAAGVMMGLGATYKITPTYSGTHLITITGNMANNVAGDGASLRMAYGTGIAPTNGAAATGTVVGSQLINKSTAANQSEPFSTTILVTGLTVGTAYWFDINLARVTGGTATISGVSCSILEV